MRTERTLKKRITKKESKFLKCLKENGLSDAMDIEGLSEIQLDKLLTKEIFKNAYYDALGISEKQAKFLRVFAKKVANVKESCKAVRIGRTTYYEWMKRNVIFKKEIENIREGLYDDVESVLYEKVFIEKDTTSLIYFTKTKMKHRGFVERSEQEVKNVDEFDKLTDEELDEELRKNGLL